MMPKKAVVIGGSIAGLLAARVLSDYFEDVLIIERDNYVENNKEIRTGTPQANHIHLLLAKGKEIWKVDPWSCPGLSAHILPLCNSTTPRAMGRPNPIPPTRRVI